jgi:hypothetical protein
MILTGENPKYSERKLSTTNLTWTGTESNLGLHGDRPENNRSVTMVRPISKHEVHLNIFSKHHFLSHSEYRCVQYTDQSVNVAQGSKRCRAGALNFFGLWTPLTVW